MRAYPKPVSMNAFLSQILIQNTLAEYEIFKRGQKYKALLVLNDSTSHLPLELTFWKESGQWKTGQMLSDHVLSQFSSHIENHVLSNSLSELKVAAA